MLDCDFKSRRCKSYCLPILKKFIYFSQTKIKSLTTILNCSGKTFYYDNFLLTIWGITLRPIKNNLYNFKNLYKLIISK